MQIEYLKTQYDFELQMVKENCNNRLKLMKENLENTHRHFVEEKDVLNKQIDLVEKEKFEIMQLNRKKCEDIQKECNFEIEKIKEIQKKSRKLTLEEYKAFIYQYGITFFIVGVQISNIAFDQYLWVDSGEWNLSSFIYFQIG